MVARSGSLDFDQARSIVIETLRETLRERPVEKVALNEAHGRILAESIGADRDYPTLERSLRDGFAVRASDVPGTLQPAGRSASRGFVAGVFECGRSD